MGVQNPHHPIIATLSPTALRKIVHSSAEHSVHTCMYIMLYIINSAMMGANIRLL